MTLDRKGAVRLLDGNSVHALLQAIDLKGRLAADPHVDLQGAKDIVDLERLDVEGLLRPGNPVGIAGLGGQGNQGGNRRADQNRRNPVAHDRSEEHLSGYK